MAITLLGLALLAALGLANLVVSLAVARSHYYGAGQKVAQITLVWALPVVGALGVGAFLYSQRDNPTFDTRAFPEPSEKAIAHTIHESIQGHDHVP
jgi:hypothetical protein